MKQLARNNLVYILSSADLIALRFLLAIAAFSKTLWVGIMFWYGMTLVEIEAIKALTFVIFPFWIWITMILVYGILGMWAVILNVGQTIEYGKAINRFVSAYGALFWSLNASLVLASMIIQGTLSFAVSQFMLALAAWWIFIRDCYGR